MDELTQQIANVLTSTGRYDTPTTIVADSVSSLPPSTYATPTQDYAANGLWAQRAESWTLCDMLCRLIRANVPVADITPDIAVEVTTTVGWDGTSLWAIWEIIQFIDKATGSVSIVASVLVAQGTWLPNTVQVLNFEANELIQQIANVLTSTGRYDTPTVIVADSITSPFPSTYTTPTQNYTLDDVWTQQNGNWTLCGMASRSIRGTIPVADVTLDIALEVAGALGWEGTSLWSVPEIWLFLDIEAFDVSLETDALVAQNTWLPGTVQVLDFDTNGVIFWETNKLFYFADFVLYRAYGVEKQVANFALYDVAPDDFTQAKAFDWRNGQLVGFALRAYTSKSTGIEPITQAYSVVTNQQSNTISPTVSQLDPQNLPWWSNGQLISVGDLITLRETQLAQWGFGQDLLQSPFMVVSPPNGVTLEQITSTALCRYTDFGSNFTIVARYWQDNRITTTFAFIYWDLVRVGITLQDPVYELITPNYIAGGWLNGYLRTSVPLNLFLLTYTPIVWSDQQLAPVQVSDLIDPSYTGGAWANGHLRSDALLDPLSLVLLIYAAVGGTQQLAPVQIYDLIDPNYKEGAWANGHLYTSVRLNLALLIYAPMSLEYGTISSANCHSNWVFSYTLDPQITLPATEISELDDKDDAWCWEANSLIMFWNRLFWPYETGRIQLSTSGLLHRTHVYEDSYVVGSNGAVYDVDYAMIDGNKLTIELPEWAPFEGRYFIVLQLEDALGAGDVYGSSFSFRNVGGIRYWPENARLLLKQNEFIFDNNDITIDLPSYLEIELPDPKPLIRDKNKQYMRKVLFHNSYPTYVNLALGNIPLAAGACARYDDVVFTARALDPWHDDYPNLPELCNKIHELNPNTRIWFSFDSSDVVQDKQDFLTKLNYLALTLHAAGVVFNSVAVDALTMAELFRAVHSFKLRVAVTVRNPKTEIFDTPLASEWWAGWDVVILRSTPFYASDDGLQFLPARDVFERPSLINYTLADYAIPYWQVTTWTRPFSSTLTDSELYEHAYYFALYMAYFQGASGFAFQPPDDYADADWLLPMLPDPLQATDYRTNASFSEQSLSDGTKVYMLSTKLGDLYMRVSADGQTPLETRFGKYATYYGLTRYEGVDKVAYKGTTRPVKVPGAVLTTPFTDPTLLREPKTMFDTAFIVYPGLAKAINLAALGLNFTARYRNAQVTKLKGDTYQVVATGDGEIAASDCEWLIFSSADNTNPAYIWLEF